MAGSRGGLRCVWPQGYALWCGVVVRSRVLPLPQHTVCVHFPLFSSPILTRPHLSRTPASPPCPSLLFYIRKESTFFPGWGVRERLCWCQFRGFLPGEGEGRRIATHSIVSSSRGIRGGCRSSSFFRHCYFLRSNSFAVVLFRGKGVVVALEEDCRPSSLRSFFP